VVGVSVGEEAELLSEFEAVRQILRRNEILRCLDARVKIPDLYTPEIVN